MTKYDGLCGAVGVSHCLSQRIRIILVNDDPEITANDRSGVF